MAGEMDIDEGEERGGRFSLERSLGAVRKHWRLPLALALLMTLSTAAFVSFIPDRYDAAAVVQIDPRKKSISNLEGVVSDLVSSNSTAENEMEILRSRSIALKVIDILGLRSDPELAAEGGIRGLFSGLFGSAPASEPRPAAAAADSINDLLVAPEPGAAEPERDAVARAFAQRLTISRVRTTLLMEIRYSSADPVKAARIANTLAEVYLKDQVEEKTRATGFATEVLDEKLGTLKKRLEEAERRVEAFKAEHNIFETEGAVLSEKQINQQMSLTMQARSALATAQAKYEQVQKLILSGEGAEGMAEVLGTEAIKVHKDALAGVARREAELEARYGPRHPEIVKVRAERREAAALLDAQIQRLVSNLKSEYEIALANERQLTENLGGLKLQQALTQEQAVKLKSLQREADTEKQVYEALLTRFKQTSETQSMQLPDARIVERADVPLSPAAPKRKLFILMALLAGLGAGLVIALALEFLTSGIVHPEDIEHTLALPHLSTVPALALGRSHLSPDEQIRALRMILAEPHGAFTEAIRGARREIDVRTRGGGARLILVASSLPTEDSDVIASNLAHHYALLGRKVLLVDGDVRRGALTRRLAPKAERGLLDVLARGIDFEQAVLRDTTTGLSFLPAMSYKSKDTANPEMLASARMAAAFTFMKRQFDTVIVNAPPILPVVDGRLLADHADLVVLVMAWKKTPKQLARRALKCLGASQDKIVGVVMNGVEPAAMAEIAGPAAAPRRVA